MGTSPADLARTLRQRAAAAQRVDAAEAERCRACVAEVLRGLRRTHDFGRAWLIGSLAWGAFGVRSDVDIVLEGASAATLLELAERVGEKTDRVVDALALEALPSGFRARVLAEGALVA